MNKLENIGNLYPHNKKVFLKVLENLKIHNKVGVVQATGTGKGKLASCFVEFILHRKKDAKILIAAPLRSVLENYRDNFNITSNSVKYATYSKINNLSEIDLINIGQQYDLIVLDEYHRCGATEWFKSIQTLFNGVDKGVCKVIGLTATPIRYLDNSRDMSEELFNGNVIQGLNLEEAILDGILPGFIYNACYFGTEKVLKEVEDKLKNNDYKISDDKIRNDLMVKVKELNMIYQNRYKIENIIKDNTKELGINQKWVIFCRDKQSLGEIREFCVNWFNYKPNLYIINSDRQAEDNDRTLQEFREVKQGINVMLCVDMLNEGVHIKDLNGVIMLRKTDSPIIFLQQLGRSLEAGKDFKPIIFDLIGNYKGLKVKQDEIERTPISIVKGIEKKTKGKRNYVIVHNFTEEMDKVMDEIASVSQYEGNWKDWEDDIIKKYYEIGGKELCRSNGLMHRSNLAILNRARKLGFIKFDMNFWTDEEIEIINKYYLEGGWELCQEKGLTNRDARAIKSKANKLGLFQKSMWTDEEIDILRTYYPIGGVLLCKEKGLINKPESSIRDKAGTLKLKSNSRYWTEKEEELLKKYYSKGGWRLCQEKGLSNKSEHSIKKKAAKLGLVADYIENWTVDEVKILKTYYPIGGSDLCIINGLNKDKNQINYKAHHLGIIIEDKAKGVWNDVELSLLTKYYPLGGVSLYNEKATELGYISRTKNAVHMKAKLLGLNVKQKYWSKSENEFLSSNLKSKGLKWCQQNGLNDCSIEMIEKQAVKLGLIEGVKKYWTEEEIDIIKKYYVVGGASLCVEKGLKYRTLGAIDKKANKIGLYFVSNFSKWTEEELNILKMYFPIGGTRLCMEKGIKNRTFDGIEVKAHKLGLRKPKK